MNVSATPMPLARTSSRSAGAAPARATPLPARITGLIAERMRSAAASSSPALGSRRRLFVLTGSGSASTGSAITSSGSSMCVGPGLGSCATLNALRTTSGITAGAHQPRVPLHDRLEHRDDVDVLVGLLVHALEVRLPGQRDERRAVQERVRDGGDEVRRARAERAEADAGAAGEAAVHVGHVGPALLVADRHEADRGVVQGLVQIEGLLARNAEHVLDALRLQAFHEQVRRLARAQLPQLLPGGCVPLR